MSNYAYVAVDPQGAEMRGTLDVPDQSAALRRIREMGLFPTKGRAANEPSRRPARSRFKPAAGRKAMTLTIPGLGGRVKPASLTVFTRQIATLVEAGMPLLRSLRTLEEQEESPRLKGIIGDLALAIEGGSSFSEAVAMHPKVFNRLYVNMVKAGEIGGALEITMQRLAEFLEKAHKIKGKIKAAMFYPCAVVVVALGILTIMTVFVVPRFKQVFVDLMGGRPMPAFTVFVLGICEGVKNHLLITGSGAVAAAILFFLALRTEWGRWAFDKFKLRMPVLGPLFRKAAISRFARTLGTLVGNGVPILQALTIVKETAANVILRQVIANVHDRVKEGDPIAPTLKASRVFPAMVAGMVDVGEQTGALPEMLLKIADNCDQDVDNAVSAMTSLLEPIMIVSLAVVVGSIVIAMFLPIITILTVGVDSDPAQRGE
jgi:type IV pilus assembly protein PilC